MTEILNSSTIDVKETSSEAKAYIKQSLIDIIRKNMRPPPRYNLVEWADRYRYLPDNSAEAGKWHTDRVEVSRQPMLSISDPKVQEITVMSCIQLMKTELMINTALYYIHQEPAPIMYVAPKKELAEAWSKERFMKSINTTPVTKEVFSNNRRGEGNTILQKQYAGGQISIVSARNPDDLAMRACMIMLFDEIDKYQVNVGSNADGGGEGDPIAVAWGRSTTYGKRAKKICACSPTVEGKSRIEKEYNKSDQRLFYQKCRHCEESKALEWDDVIIPKDDGGNKLWHEAFIVCSHCGAKWDEGDRHYSIANGHWVAQRPENSHHHGYRVTSLASPFTSVKMLAKEFVDAGDDIEMVKAFYNTRMARTWRERGDQPSWKRLYDTRERYPIGIIPEGGLMLTCGIDVQKDYLAYEVVAWGRRKESWSVDKGSIEGNIEDASTREKLRIFLDKTYKNAVGIELSLEKVAIDSGYNTQEIYSFVREYGSERVMAVKGDDGLRSVIGTPRPVDVNYDGKKISRGVMLWTVGSSVIKEQVYRWLNLERPTDEQLDATEGRFPSGFCHFPEYDEEFFRQMTAEQYIQQTDGKGFSRYIWEKLRKDNHFLDCRVYARAASAMLQIDRMKESDWDVRESFMQPSHHIQNQDIQVPVSDTFVTKPNDNMYRDQTGRLRKRGRWLAK